MKKTFIVLHTLLTFSAGALLQSSCGTVSELHGAQDSDAATLSYDNTASGLSASNLQDAIDELYAMVKLAERIDYSAQIIGSWSGAEYTATINELSLNAENVSLVFNSDKTYSCQNAVELSSICSTGTWEMIGKYLVLESGSTTQILKLGSVNEDSLHITADDIFDAFGVFILQKV